MPADPSFDIAASEAANDLEVDLLPKLTAEEKAGVRKFIAWWLKWYMKAGHNRLARIFIHLKL